MNDEDDGGVPEPRPPNPAPQTPPDPTLPYTPPYSPYQTLPSTPTILSLSEVLGSSKCMCVFSEARGYSNRCLCVFRSSWIK